MTKTWNPVLSISITMAGVALLSLGANAQTACQGSTGPDIIVGDIQDIANYAGNNVGGVDYEALALGTYSCNMGTVWCNWISGTNEHPVIGCELYKYKVVSGAGRFEQLGISWLKHGFFALSDNLCCTGCQGTDGTHLGVKCSDPYTASRNGGQGSAGPRWQVNASSGVFTYPPANPAFSGSTARRCQVKVSDLEPSSGSVLYFGEAQYVSHDDAVAGNNNNNASNRPVTVSGSGTSWTFALGGSTQREKPAITQWKNIDPAVQINNIDISGDGRVILAFKTTALGGGQWHYEYALHNLNSDRSIQAFSIPIGTATLSNIGFHDVSYHDNDGVGNVTFDGTDWPATVSGGAITWATQTFAVNQNANALRWATMYNFRFDADTPPSSTMITLTTFKTVGNVITTADAPGIASPGGPMVSFCDPGAAGVMACPCANPALFPGMGCDNSSATGGATLSATGNAAVTTDTVVFSTLGEKPTATSIVLQGDAPLAAGIVFGQGIRCAGGTLKRLYTKTAVGGAITAPAGGDPSVTARSSALGDTIVGGTHRYYDVYYRDPIVLGGCPVASTFNITQAMDVTWNP